MSHEYSRRLAQERTTAARQELEALSRILTDSLKLEHKFDWDELKERGFFDQPQPIQPGHDDPPRAPERSDPEFQTCLTFLEKLIPSLGRRKRQQDERAFESARHSWNLKVEELDRTNKWLQTEYRKELLAWEQRKREFQQAQRAQHGTIEVKKAAYLAKESSLILDYCTCVLRKSVYPSSFPRSCVLEYLAESGTLIAEYQVPSLSHLPRVKEVRYVATRNEFHTVTMSDAWLARTYDSVLYQIALRTLWELFESDSIGAIASIVFNGWVEAIDKATGKNFRACVLSVQASKEEFLDINLAQVDPKSCFKKLKGISGAQLAEVLPVRPILQISREDKRFVPGYSVVDALDTGTNLAAMDWLDFENLIRELFQKEFSKNGGEVKITQASRDGGVDAIAFDPDPIRGGKIVIQAKRYTNTVSVSAVRDLYGTIVNEGANKGILVTTADYGRDAYEFAKDKPITLLSGSELLHLLAQHGHRARIDLSEARKLEHDGGSGTRSFRITEE